MPENESSVTLSNEEPSGGASSNNGWANVDPGTIQEVIAYSVGSYAVVEFLIGTGNIVRKEGVITAVGVSWLLLYDEASGTSVVCDMYSVKFVTYFDPGRTPADTDTGTRNFPSAQRQMDAQNQSRNQPQNQTRGRNNNRGWR